MFEYLYCIAISFMMWYADENTLFVFLINIIITIIFIIIIIIIYKYR